MITNVFGEKKAEMMYESFYPEEESNLTEEENVYYDKFKSAMKNRKILNFFLPQAVERLMDFENLDYNEAKDFITEHSTYVTPLISKANQRAYNLVSGPRLEDGYFRSVRHPPDKIPENIRREYISSNNFYENNCSKFTNSLKFYHPDYGESKETEKHKIIGEPVPVSGSMNLIPEYDYTRI
jgi:hypothetical protein